MPSHNIQKILPRKIASFANLKKFWKKLPSYKKPKGQQGKFYEENIDAILFSISKCLTSGKYKFQNLSFKPVFKENGKIRIICCPSFRDRFVQRFILDQLTDSKDRLSIGNKISFGSLRGSKQSVHSAVKLAINYRKKSQWVLKTDISSFFDQINRLELINFLRKKLKNSSLLPLLEQVINCEIQTKNSDEKKLLHNSGIISGKGLRQGMPLSPLLSNIFMSQFDKYLIKNDIKAIRYVDDIIVFCKSEDECINKKILIENELKKLQLSIPSLSDSNSKTEIKKPGESVIFLGIEIYRTKSGKYLQKIPGKIFKRCIDELTINYSCYKKLLEIGYTFSKAMQKIDNKMKGYQSAFKHATNVKQFIEKYQQAIKKAQEKIFFDIFGDTLFQSLDKYKKRFLGFDI